MDPYTSRLGTSPFYHTGINSYVSDLELTNMLAKNNKIQITAGLLNPFGSQSQFGSDSTSSDAAGSGAALDAEGAATVGGVNTPPVSDRTGLPSGKGTAASDMSSTQLNANIGRAIPELKALWGEPDDTRRDDTNKDC